MCRTCNPDNYTPVPDQPGKSEMPLGEGDLVICFNENALQNKWYISCKTPFV